MTRLRLSLAYGQRIPGQGQFALDLSQSPRRRRAQLAQHGRYDLPDMRQPGGMGSLVERAHGAFGLAVVEVR